MAEIPGDEVDGCTLTELMYKLNMRHFTQPSIPEGQIASERQAKYNAHPYDDPDEKGNEPSHPLRINPKISDDHHETSEAEKESGHHSSPPMTCGTCAQEMSWQDVTIPVRVSQSAGPLASDSDTTHQPDSIHQPDYAAVPGPRAHISRNISPKPSDSDFPIPSQPNNLDTTPRVRIPPVIRISQAADDTPSRVTSNSPTAPKISQAIYNKPSRVASDGLATPQNLSSYG